MNHPSTPLGVATRVADSFPSILWGYHILHHYLLLSPSSEQALIIKVLRVLRHSNKTFNSGMEVSRLTSLIGSDPKSLVKAVFGLNASWKNQTFSSLAKRSKVALLRIHAWDIQTAVIVTQDL